MTIVRNFQLYGTKIFLMPTFISFGFSSLILKLLQLFLERSLMQTSTVHFEKTFQANTFNNLYTPFFFYQTGDSYWIESPNNRTWLTYNLPLIYFNQNFYQDTHQYLTKFLANYFP